MWEAVQPKAFIRRSLATRVGRRVFVTVPHRYFPVEHHTAIPVAALHRCWLPLGMPDHGENLLDRGEEPHLMTRRLLASLCPVGVPRRIGTTGLPLGLFSSNLYLALNPVQ